MTASPPPRLDAETERAARAFMRRLESDYPVVEGLVFGSRARGAHTADSDADLAVIFKDEGSDRWALTRAMSGIAFDVMLETGILIQPLPLWEGELKRAELFTNPALIETIMREGWRL